MLLWLDLPEELSVLFGDLAGAAHRDEVAVVGPDLHHHAGLVPLLGVVAVLLLDDDVVSDLQRRKETGAAGQSLLHVELPLTVSLRSLVSCEPPVLSGDKFAWLERESVTENTAKEDLGRTEADDGTGSVPVDEEGLGKFVSVQAAGLRSVASDESLGVFHSQFCPLVGSGMIS